MLALDRCRSVVRSVLNEFRDWLSFLNCVNVTLSCVANLLVSVLALMGCPFLVLGLVVPNVRVTRPFNLTQLMTSLRAPLRFAVGRAKWWPACATVRNNARWCSGWLRHRIRLTGVLNFARSPVAMTRNVNGLLGLPNWVPTRVLRVWLRVQDRYLMGLLPSAFIATMMVARNGRFCLATTWLRARSQVVISLWLNVIIRVPTLLGVIPVRQRPRTLVYMVLTWLGLSRTAPMRLVPEVRNLCRLLASLLLLVTVLNVLLRVAWLRRKLIRWALMRIGISVLLVTDCLTEQAPSMQFGLSGLLKRVKAPWLPLETGALARLKKWVPGSVACTLLLRAFLRAWRVLLMNMTTPLCAPNLFVFLNWKTAANMTFCPLLCRTVCSLLPSAVAAISGSLVAPNRCLTRLTRLRWLRMMMTAGLLMVLLPNNTSVVNVTSRDPLAFRQRYIKFPWLLVSICRMTVLVVLIRGQ